MSKELEQVLKKRLATRTSKDFDKDFWNKFNNENKQSKENWFSLSFLAPMAVAMILVFFIATQSQLSPIDKKESLNETFANFLVI